MSRLLAIKGPAALTGEAVMPGDKSISHRVALLASIADGPSTIRGFASSADCQSTLDCIARLGIKVEREGDLLKIHGEGMFGFNPRSGLVKLHAGNSGSTIRMLAGLLAAQGFTSEIDGDESIRRRPMKRVIEPLSRMGAEIEARDGNYAPITIKGVPLRAIDYASPVASAQVKTAVLLAGLYASGRTTLVEPAPSRNHTELMLEEFRAPVELLSGGGVAISRCSGLNPVDYAVPGDISSAAFFIAGAASMPGSSLTLKDVGLNPSRTAFLDVLEMLGARVERRNLRSRHNEIVGDLYVEHSLLPGSPAHVLLRGEIIANLIDEIPVLAVAATQHEGTFEVREAGELRLKESDRIRTVVEAIGALGGEVEELEDGFRVIGPRKLKGGRVSTRGDHRIAMAFSIAGLMSDAETEIVDAGSAGVSFPEFYDVVRRLAGEERVVG
ncbi:MAG TPA: 3-phosphoshikimate 1-carboxyvinyltransferase [Blastocatellia bacterium]